MRKIMLISLFCSFRLFGQNLVFNPGFEIYENLPYSGGQLERSTGWINPSGTSITKPGFGSPDFFHAKCNPVTRVQLPETFSSYITSHNGEAIAGIITLHYYDNREYLQTKLIKPLEEGRRYKVSMWVNNGERYFYGCASSHNLGMLFTTSKVNQVWTLPIEIEPQFKVKYGLWTNSWTQLSFEIEADSSYTYLTIGNFNLNAETSKNSVTDNCTNKQVSYVFIDDVEVLDISPKLLASSDNSICLGDSITLSAWDGSSYTWLEEGVIISHDSVLNVRPTRTTVFTVYDSRDTIHINITVEQPPLFTLGPDSVYCFNNPVTYNFNHEKTDFLWQDGSADSSRTITKKGIYWLQASRGKCQERDTVILDFIPKTVFTLSEDTAICKGDTLNIHGRFIGDSFVYYWNNQYLDTTVKISDEGIYGFTLVDRCEEVDYSFEVNSVWCNCEVYVPNAFSPNKDGINESFGASFNCPIQNYYMVIYSLWGERIFESHNTSVKWDGTFKGEPCQSDLYLYRIMYNNLDKEPVSGAFILMR